MSIEYTFYNKPLSRKELLDTTDLKIKKVRERHSQKYVEIIYDDNEGEVAIKSAADDNIYELETGYKWNNIIDTIVSKFNIVFYTDNSIDQHFRFQTMGREEYKALEPTMVNDDNEFNWDQAVVDDMMMFGEYEVVDLEKGIVNVPNRIG
jgi:hypothetical protein